MDVPARQSSNPLPSSRAAESPAAPRAPAATPAGRGLNPFAGVLAAARARALVHPGLSRSAPAARASTTTGGAASPRRSEDSAAHEPVDGVDGDRGAGDGDRDARDGGGSSREDRNECDVLDPAARQLALLGPPLHTTAPTAVDPAASDAPVRARSLEELLPALVRKIAWAGDRQKGTVVLELGAGAYAGTTLVVHADAGRVRVEINGQGPELDRLRARLDARLRGHGLDVESVT